MTEYGFSCPISVRAGDIDANRHVNNTVYSDYFQEARANYFRTLWGDDWTESSVVIATITIDFVSSIEFDDEVSVDVRVSEVGESSWTVEYRARAISDGEERVAARGTSVQVAWDREQGASRSLPESWREKLAGELVAPEA